MVLSDTREKWYGSSRNKVVWSGFRRIWYAKYFRFASD